MPNHIGQNIQCDRHVLGQQHGVIRSVVLGCIRVHRGAHPFNIERETARVASVRPLERHVLKKVRDPVQRWRLITRTNPHKRTDRRGPKSAQAYARHRQPVVQFEGAQIRRGCSHG